MCCCIVRDGCWGGHDKCWPTEMGIPKSLLHKFEFGKARMPSSLLLKIFMFGLDFWTDGIYWVPEDEPNQNKERRH